MLIGNIFSCFKKYCDFMKSLNPFLGFGQCNIDSKFQDLRVNSVALGGFTSSKPSILDQFFGLKKFLETQKMTFSKNPKNHF